MTLEQYIKELLFEYECVTIPNFGAFLTRSYDFIINKETEVTNLLIVFLFEAFE